MPADDVPSLVLLACCLLCCVALQALVSRHRPPAAPAAKDPRWAVGPREVWIAATCAFLCAVGIILLLPWASAVPYFRTAGVVPGVLVLLALGAGAVYALVRGDRSGGEGR